MFQPPAGGQPPGFVSARIFHYNLSVTDPRQRAEPRQPYLNNHLHGQPRLGVPTEWLAGMQAGAGVPLIAHDQLIGFLWIGRGQAIAEAETRLLTAVADIAANALHRATLRARPDSQGDCSMRCGS